VYILVINSGSSSIKFSIFNAEDASDPKPILDGQLSGIGTPDARLERAQASTAVQAQTPADAIHLVFDELTRPGIPAFQAIGYRVVHPGPNLDRHQRITPQVLADLDHAASFAPLHDPDAVKLIREAMARFPHLPHYACFDTVFHQTMPEAAKTYPIPLQFRAQGVRRYGFHGLSCESIVRQMQPNIPARMIIAHLGSGCSVTALVDGKSVDNTMGLTPTGGVVMGTRPGDLDPGLIFYLLRQKDATVASVETMLNHDAGLQALFGVNDMRKLRESTNDRATLAIAIFCNSIRKAIGACAAAYGLDAIVFAGGIGEHDPLTRAAAADHLFHDQVLIDPTTNQAKAHGLRKISSEASPIAVYVVPAQEDLMIAIHVGRMATEN
jgi:acetate kinase